MKNKIPIILSTFIFLILFIYSSVFAYDFSFVSDDVSYEVTLSDEIKEYPYYVLQAISDTRYWLSLSYEPLIVESSTNRFLESDSFIDSGGGYPILSNFLNHLSTATPIPWSAKNTPIVKILYSNYDIYDDNGNLVFHQAPVTVEQVTIPEITQAKEIPQAMTEVMKILLPVGLIIFGIGLLIYLMRLVIYRMKS